MIMIIGVWLQLQSWLHIYNFLRWVCWEGLPVISIPIYTYRRTGFTQHIQVIHFTKHYCPAIQEIHPALYNCTANTQAQHDSCTTGELKLYRAEPSWYNKKSFFVRKDWLCLLTETDIRRSFYPYFYPYSLCIFFYPSAFGCKGYCHGHDGWAGSHCLAGGFGFVPTVTQNILCYFIWDFHDSRILSCRCAW